MEKKVSAIIEQNWTDTDIIDPVPITQQLVRSCYKGFSVLYKDRIYLIGSETVNGYANITEYVDPIIPPLSQSNTFSVNVQNLPSKAAVEVFHDRLYVFLTGGWTTIRTYMVFQPNKITDQNGDHYSWSQLSGTFYLNYAQNRYPNNSSRYYNTITQVVVHKYDEDHMIVFYNVNYQTMYAQEFYYDEATSLVKTRMRSLPSQATGYMWYFANLGKVVKNPYGSGSSLLFGLTTARAFTPQAAGTLISKSDIAFYPTTGTKTYSYSGSPVGATFELKFFGSFNTTEYSSARYDRITGSGYSQLSVTQPTSSAPGSVSFVLTTYAQVYLRFTAVNDEDSYAITFRLNFNAGALTMSIEDCTSLLNYNVALYIESLKLTVPSSSLQPPTLPSQSLSEALYKIIYNDAGTDNLIQVTPSISYPISNIFSTEDKVYCLRNGTSLIQIDQYGSEIPVNVFSAPTSTVTDGTIIYQPADTSLGRPARIYYLGGTQGRAVRRWEFAEDGSISHIGPYITQIGQHNLIEDHNGDLHIFGGAVGYALNRHLCYTDTGEGVKHWVERSPIPFDIIDMERIAICADTIGSQINLYTIEQIEDTTNYQLLLYVYDVDSDTWNASTQGEPIDIGQYPINSTCKRIYATEDPTNLDTLIVLPSTIDTEKGRLVIRHADATTDYIPLSDYPTQASTGSATSTIGSSLTSLSEMFKKSDMIFCKTTERYNSYVRQTLKYLNVNESSGVGSWVTVAATSIQNTSAAPLDSRQVDYLIPVLDAAMIVYSTKYSKILLTTGITQTSADGLSNVYKDILFARDNKIYSIGSGQSTKYFSVRTYTGANKICVGDEDNVVLDLSDDTVNPSRLLGGYIATDRHGEPIIGTATMDATVNSNTHLVYNKSAYAKNTKYTGTRPYYTKFCNTKMKIYSRGYISFTGEDHNTVDTCIPLIDGPLLKGQNVGIYLTTGKVLNLCLPGSSSATTPVLKIADVTNYTYPVYILDIQILNDRQFILTYRWNTNATGTTKSATYARLFSIKTTVAGVDTLVASSAMSISGANTATDVYTGYVIPMLDDGSSWMLVQLGEKIATGAKVLSISRMWANMSTGALAMPSSSVWTTLASSNVNTVPGLPMDDNHQFISDSSYHPRRLFTQRGGLVFKDNSNNHKIVLWHAWNSTQKLLTISASTVTDVFGVPYAPLKTITETDSNNIHKRIRWQVLGWYRGFLLISAFKTESSGYASSSTATLDLWVFDVDFITGVLTPVGWKTLTTLTGSAHYNLRYYDTTSTDYTIWEELEPSVLLIGDEVFASFRRSQPWHYQLILEGYHATLILKDLSSFDNFTFDYTYIDNLGDFHIGKYYETTYQGSLRDTFFNFYSGNTTTNQ